MCAVVGYRIATGEPGDPLTGRIQAHESTCLRCQAVHARDRRLRRALGDLALRTLLAPPGLVSAVRGLIEGEPVAVRPVAVARPSNGRRWPMAATGTLVGVAAVAAGGVAIAAWRIGRRPA